MKIPAWLERASPGSLGVFLSKTASPRKSGLFVRHLCRACPEAFADPRSLAALDAADQYEAGEIDELTLRAATQAAEQAAEDAEARLRAIPIPQAGNWPDSYGPASSAMTATAIAREIATRGCYNRVTADLMRLIGASTCPRSTSRKRAARAIRGLFLEHFGDVERPVVVEPSWWTSAVVGLATSIYAERAFSHMPILADALEDAGCADSDILGHCRGGQHARGCFVLDLVLGKS